MSKRSRVARASSAYKTPAQRVFDGKQLLTKRQDGMTYDEYTILRRIQNEVMNTVRLPRCPDRYLSRMIPQRLGYNFHPIVYSPPPQTPEGFLENISLVKKAHDVGQTEQ